MSALVTNIRNFNFKVMKNGIAWLEREIKCLGREEKKKLQQARNFGQRECRQQERPSLVQIKKKKKSLKKKP